MSTDTKALREWFAARTNPDDLPPITDEDVLALLDAADRLAEVEAENGRLVRAIRLYGTHSAGCAHRLGHDCDCGYEALAAGGGE